VPFDAIVAFYDPAVQFGFQFEPIDGEHGELAKAVPASEDKIPQKPAALPAGRSAEGKKAEAAPAADKAPTDDDDTPDGGGEVVRFDRFRKK